MVGLQIPKTGDRTSFDGGVSAEMGVRAVQGEGSIGQFYSETFRFAFVYLQLKIR